jgi:hypothetical protein
LIAEVPKLLMSSPPLAGANGSLKEAKNEVLEFPDEVIQPQAKAVEHHSQVNPGSIHEADVKEEGQSEELDQTDEEEETDEADEDEDDDNDDNEEEEPALKYERIGGALNDLLKKDSASALAVSNKVLVSSVSSYRSHCHFLVCPIGNGYSCRHCSYSGSYWEANKIIQTTSSLC